MAIDPAALDHAVDGFLDLVHDPAGWPPALDAFSDAIGATGLAIFTAGERGPTPGPFPHSRGLADLVEVYLRERWFAADERFRGAPTLARRGFFTDDDCMAADLRRRHTYYQDFIRRAGFDGFVGLRLDINGTLSCASIHRTVGLPPFAPDEIDALRRVAPRISMATSILVQIDRARVAGIGDALEAMTTPAFLLDAHGGVVRGNAAAAAVIGHGIEVAEGRLTAAGPDGGALQKLLARVMWPEGIAAPQSGVPLPIRRAGGRPLLVRVQRLRSEPALDYFSRAQMLVTVTDPDRRSRSAAETLRLLFGLTEKEAGVVLALLAADGDGAATAGRCQVSYETFRTHMKNIHAKAGTAGVADLMALATRLAGPADD